MHKGERPGNIYSAEDCGISIVFYNIYLLFPALRIVLLHEAIVNFNCRRANKLRMTIALT